MNDRTVRRRKRKPIGKQIEAMREFIRSLRGSLKKRPGEPLALDILRAERHNERYK